MCVPKLVGRGLWMIADMRGESFVTMFTFEASFLNKLNSSFKVSHLSALSHLNKTSETEL